MAYEQRRFPRHESRALVTLQLYLDENGKTVEKDDTGVLADLSEGGIQVDMTDPPPVDTELDLHFELAQGLSGSAYVTARGKVVRLQEPSDTEMWGVSVTFTYLPEESLNIIKNYVGRGRKGSFL